MEECVLDLIFLLGTARPFVFLVGGAVFFQYVKLDFLRQSESIFVTIESVVKIAIITVSIHCAPEMSESDCIGRIESFWPKFVRGW